MASDLEDIVQLNASAAELSEEEPHHSHHRGHHHTHHNSNHRTSEELHLSTRGYPTRQRNSRHLPLEAAALVKESDVETELLLDATPTSKMDHLCHASLSRMSLSQFDEATMSPHSRSSLTADSIRSQLGSCNSARRSDMSGSPHAHNHTLRDGRPSTLNAGHAMPMPTLSAHLGDDTGPALVQQLGKMVNPVQYSIVVEEDGYTFGSDTHDGCDDAVTPFGAPLQMTEEHESDWANVNLWPAMQ